MGLNLTKEGRLNRLRMIWDKCLACANLPAKYENAFGVVNYEKKVFCRGDASADVMGISEAPGINEEAQGVAFVGRSGQYLAQAFTLAGWSIDDIYITNVLLCRPPNDRDPLPPEIRACGPRLREQIKIVRPKAILTFGNFATKVMTGTNLGITKIHGTYDIIEFDDFSFYLMPMYHPSFLLRRGGAKSLEHPDFIAALSRLKGLVYGWD